MSTFTKNNRLFYLGLLLLFFAFVLCIVDYILGPSSFSLSSLDSNNNNMGIGQGYKMHHIHHIVNNSSGLPNQPLVEQRIPEITNKSLIDRFQDEIVKPSNFVSQKINNHINPKKNIK
jgi:hypothetical protein